MFTHSGRGCRAPIDPVRAQRFHTNVGVPALTKAKEKGPDEAAQTP